MATTLATTVTALAQTVVVVVNGEPITAIDVEQRSKFIQMSSQKAPPRQEVLDELIDEKLKVREGKRWGIEITEAEVDGMYANMASRMRQTADQLTQNLGKGGVYANTLKSRIRADQVWQQLVRGRYQPSLQLSEKDIELALQAKNRRGKDTTGYRIHPAPDPDLGAAGLAAGDVRGRSARRPKRCAAASRAARRASRARALIGRGRARPGHSQLRRPYAEVA